jgi:uncharacterized CHY-type Zn-finger protein
MQIVCGQCGTRHTLEEVPQTAQFVCDSCDHAISLYGFNEAAGDRPPRHKEMFPDLEVGFDKQVRKALRERLLVICGNCMSKMKVGKRLAGKKVKCPACASDIRIPFMDEEDEFDISKLTSFSEEEEEEVLELSDTDYEMQAEELLIGTRFFRLTRRKLVTMVVIYVIGIVGVFIGTIVYRNIRAGLAQSHAGPEIDLPSAERRSARVVSPEARLTDVRWDSFASNGYWPAGPGRLYCKATVFLKAGNETAAFANHGGDVILRLGTQTYQSLGEPLHLAYAPIQARRDKVAFNPMQERGLTFLFEVPAGEETGFLEVRGFGTMDVKLPAVPTAADRIVGTYREAPPRNLKPFLDDPVMQAVQEAMPQRLLVEAETIGYAVRIPEANITGQARHAIGGLFDLTLWKDEQSLDCKLRILPGGETLILYLNEAPLHQMTYSREPSAGQAEAVSANPPEPTP